MATAPQYEDQELLLKLQNGDPYAFERLYNQYSKPLLWRLEKTLKDPNTADELLQELFIKVWERRIQIDPSQSFPAYLTRIAQHMVVDHFRKIARTSSVHRQVQIDQSELVFSTEEYLNNKETQKLIDEAVELLPRQRKEAFTLCKLNGKSHKEAAELMNISPNTVHNHLVKAVQAIKGYLNERQNPISDPLAILVAISFL